MLYRADFTLLENYAPADCSPLPIPLTAMGANGDNRYSPDQIEAWEPFTSDKFEIRWWEGKKDYWGNPHRYMIDNPDDLLAFLSNDLIPLTM